jgi:hypothetical protein
VTCRITQTANTFHASVARERTGISRPINREVPEFVVEGLLEGINVKDDGFEGVHDIPEEMGYNRIDGEDPGLARTTVEEEDAVSQTFTPLGERVGAVPRRSRRIQSRHTPSTLVRRLFTRVSRLITDIFPVPAAAVDLVDYVSEAAATPETILGVAASQDHFAEEMLELQYGDGDTTAAVASPPPAALFREEADISDRGLGVTPYSCPEKVGNLVIVKPQDRLLALMYQFCDQAGNAWDFCDRFLGLIREETNLNGFNITSSSITQRTTYVLRQQNYLEYNPPRRRYGSVLSRGASSPVM